MHSVVMCASAGERERERVQVVHASLNSLWKREEKFLLFNCTQRDTQMQGEKDRGPRV